MSFNILEPNVVKLNKDLSGQQILLYGSNSTGKSYQASRFNREKTLFLPFEDGIRTLPGVKFFTIDSWASFKKINRELTKPKTLDQVKEAYRFIVIDELYTAAKYLNEFICRKFGVETVGDGNHGYGLWSHVENEWFTEMDKLIKAGFTLIFIGHEARDRDTKQIVPKGDSRTVQFIRDNCDLCVNVRSNGVDENGKVIPSSAYLAETPEYFARSRFPYITPYIEEFSAENLKQAIIDAIEKQEEIEGVKAVDFEEHAKDFESEELDFEQVKTEVSEIGQKIADAGLVEDLVELMDKHLGTGKTVKDTRPSDVEFLSLLLLDLKDLAERESIE